MLAALRDGDVTVEAEKGDGAADRFDRLDGDFGEKLRAALATAGIHADTSAAPPVRA